MKYTIKNKYGSYIIKYGMRESMDYQSHTLTIFTDDTSKEIVRDVDSYKQSEEELPPIAFYNNGDRYGSEEC